MFDKKRVFIVHGHDGSTKTEVARLVELLGLKAIILHEQANNGKTIIEKFEKNAINVGFSIILLTPDDIASSVNNLEKKMFRARQNVILELGYFLSLIGRNRVCVLVKGDIEIPSDYMGVVYVSIDESGGWKFRLASEMKHAGMNVDLNRLSTGI